MSFYSDYVRHNNNRCVEENSHSKQELLTELDKISESQLRTTESLAYKIDRYMYSEKQAGCLLVSFGLLFGAVFFTLSFFFGCTYRGAGVMILDYWWGLLIGIFTVIFTLEIIWSVIYGMKTTWHISTDR